LINDQSGFFLEQGKTIRQESIVVCTLCKITVCRASLAGIIDRRGKNGLKIYIVLILPDVV